MITKSKTSNNLIGQCHCKLSPARRSKYPVISDSNSIDDISGIDSDRFTLKICCNQIMYLSDENRFRSRIKTLKLAAQIHGLQKYSLEWQLSKTFSLWVQSSSDLYSHSEKSEYEDSHATSSIRIGISFSDHSADWSIVSQDPLSYPSAMQAASAAFVSKLSSQTLSVLLTYKNI